MHSSNEIERTLSELSRRAGSATTTKKPSQWRHWALWIIAALALPPAFYFIDTQLFPVVSHAHVLIYESPPDETHIQLVFDKRRDCKLISSDIFITGNAVRPVETTEPMRANRPVGRNIGPRRVLLVQRETFIENGSIVVRHRCHWLWTHRARMY